MQCDVISYYYYHATNIVLVMYRKGAKIVDEERRAFIRADSIQ
jgi:hypothetical protein